MTFVVKYRGGPTARAEYWCPLHGVFEATVARGELGDPAPTASCTAELVALDPDKPGWIQLVPCGAESPWTLTEAPAHLTVYGQVRRGKVEKTDNPLALDTSELGEGMPYHEWRRKRDAKIEAFAEKEAKLGREVW